MDSREKIAGCSRLKSQVFKQTTIFFSVKKYEKWKMWQKFPHGSLYSQFAT